jgi:hypothetical protein
VRYFDLEKEWPRIVPHLETNPVIRDTLAFHFGRYTQEDFGIPFAGYPCLFEKDSSWRKDIPTPHPEYMRWVCLETCFVLVNFLLALSKAVEPERQWRIIYSENHATVWDGLDTLFEFNYLALGIPPQDCFHFAYSKELIPGEYL